MNSLENYRYRITNFNFADIAGGEQNKEENRNTEDRKPVSRCEQNRSELLGETTREF